MNMAVLVTVICASKPFVIGFKKVSNVNQFEPCLLWCFWSHDYTSWDQVQAPSPLGDTNVMGLNLDWHRFVTDRTIDFLIMRSNRYER